MWRCALLHNMEELVSLNNRFINLASPTNYKPMLTSVNSYSMLLKAYESGIYFELKSLQEGRVI